MVVPSIWISLSLGILLSLVFTEITGVLPAGLIVPGYLALLTHRPVVLLLIFLISLLSYIIVVFGIEKVTIIYGKRKFAAMITVAILLNLVIHYVFHINPVETLELGGIGVMVPGIIANTIQRQGFIPTIGSTTLLTILTLLGVRLYYILL